MENIVTTWNSLTAEKQLDWLKACTVKATMREIADGDTARFLEYHGMDDLTAEAWLKVAERLTPDYLTDLNTKRAAEGKAEITLASVVYCSRSRFSRNSAARRWAPSSMLNRTLIRYSLTQSAPPSSAALPDIHNLWQPRRYRPQTPHGRR